MGLWDQASARQPGRISRALMATDPANRRHAELRDKRALADELGVDKKDQRAATLTRAEIDARLKASKAREKEIANLRKKLTGVQKVINRKRSQGIPDSQLKGQLSEADQLAKELHKLLTGE